MKSTAVDESLSSMNQQFCSRENQLLQMLQQNEKSTQIATTKTLPCLTVYRHNTQRLVTIYDSRGTAGFAKLTNNSSGNTTCTEKELKL